jgi:ClpP class serine protease
MFKDSYLMIDELAMIGINQRMECIKKIDIKLDKALIESMVEESEVSLLGKPVLQKEGNRAMISISGPMMFEPGLFEQVIFGASSTQKLMAAVADVAQDSSIDKVLFNINSPGGEAKQMHILAAQVKTLSAMKQTASLNTGMMASAAYYIGSQASKVFSTDKFNETGSIGTVTVMADQSEAAKMAGIKVIKIATGPLKGAGMTGTAITADMVDAVQKKVNQLQEGFSSAVERGRPNADMADGSEARSGQSFFQEDAERLGLSDGIKSLDEAFEFLDQGSRANNLRRSI